MPVGRGPSGNRWPRCASHFAQRTSVRIIPCDESVRSSTGASGAGFQNDGHPLPDSNFSSLRNSSVPHTTHVYTPGSWSSQKQPVNAGSVASRCVTAYCSGVSRCRSSSSANSTRSTAMPATLTTVPQLFVGVWPGPKAMKALLDYPRPEGATAWSSPAQWLVNVRPLGRVTDAVVRELVDTLSFELDGMPKPKATLLTPRHGSWLRTPVEGLEELCDVVFDVTMPIVPVTHPKSLPWEVTVVLSRDRAPKELVHPLGVSWTVGEVVLARAVRTPAGHGYETVESFRLGP